MPRFQLLTVATAVATYLLIVLGAVVRVTGSGLGCPDWPTCHGQLLPPADFGAIIEYTHRLAAAVTALLIAAVVAAALRRRHDRRLLLPALATPALLAVQIVLGAVTVLLELPPFVVLVHLAIAMIILGLLIWMAVHAGPAPEAQRNRVPGLPKLTLVATGAAFALAMTGALVRATGAGFACVGFPDCNGSLAPFGQNRLIDIQLLHRFVAYTVALFLAAVAWRAWKQRGLQPGLGAAALALGAALLAQLAIGATAVSTQLPVALRGLHVAGAAAVWAATVALLALAVRGTAVRPGASTAAPGTGDRAGPAVPSRLGTMVRAYFALTKPRIIPLLLLTTLAAMMVAAGGLPPLGLMAATLAGGAISAGAANAFNCYIDRDIDGLMGRTSLRPIPSGVISPRSALAFGGALTVASTLVLGLLVNWLASLLALCGLLYYVLVYSCWLKRSTPSNIVIGGAAGAVPPLVGWAAVTGEISLLAVYLFAVIFFWTPPHFWALALLIRREYEKARVPMLPIVRGDAETRHQILIYSLWLVAFTLLVVVFRQVGIFYFIAAGVLGGLFLYHAVRLLRDATALAARRLFRYSILYLALLFAAMVVDQWKV